MFTSIFSVKLPFKTSIVSYYNNISKVVDFDAKSLIPKISSVLQCQ